LNNLAGLAWLLPGRRRALAAAGCFHWTNTGFLKPLPDWPLEIAGLVEEKGRRKGWEK